MRFTQTQVDACCEVGETAFNDSWRGWLVRTPTQRQWLYHEIVAAAEDEWGLHCGVDARSGMVSAVKDRVYAENEKCGFILTELILFAVLSWLIQRLLDWMFLESERTPIGRP